MEAEEAPVYAEDGVYTEGAPAEAEPYNSQAPEAPVEQEYAGYASAEEMPAEAEYPGYAHETAYPHETVYSHEAVAPPPEDHLPAGLRLTRSSDDLRGQHRGISGWIVALVSILCLLAGGLAGYFVRSSEPAAANTAVAVRAAAERTAPVIALNPAVLADVDAAFAANKAGQFADARQRFDTLAEQHPNWTSMRIEAARTTLYEHDFDGAAQILATVQRAGANADAEFLTGLLQMTTQTYDKSEAAFEKAVAIDPARADIFYFWGECLRREGKPSDAANKFREALMRNQYETTEGLYLLKLWLSEIQADQEAAKETNAKIDADLASGHPSGPALFAAAAREIKAGQFKEAGAHVGQAQKVMEPAVFRVILQDPTFLEQNFRPELAPYYRQ